MRALLVRHCQSTGPEPDAPLTPRGLEQRRAMAAALGGETMDPVVCSPYRRACQTAEALAGAARPRVDDRLREWTLPWIPRAEWPGALRAVFAGRARLPADVEPLAAARARGLAVFQEVIAAHSGLPVIVTHGKLLALVVSALDRRDAYDVFVGLETPHVLEVDGVGHELRVRTLWTL